MKLRNILLILAAITLGFASCSSESDILSEIDTPVNGLDEETVAVSFNLGKDLQTKAGNGTQDASYDEATINNCIIAIFDKRDGLLLAKREVSLNNGLTEAEPALDGSKTYSITGIETKSVYSHIIVIANYPEGAFDGVITEAGLKKELTASLDKNNLMKSWEDDITPTSNMSIDVFLKQCAARVDLELKFQANSNQQAAIKNISITMSKVNQQTNTFPTTQNVATNWNNQISQNGSDVAAGNSSYTQIASFYSYSTPNNETLTLTLEGDIQEGAQTIKHISHTITIQGSNGMLESGCLYKICGTVTYEGKIEVSLKYQVLDWENIRVEVPSFE